MIAAPVDVMRDLHEHITIHAAPTERAEAEFVVATIERLIGGHSFFSIDSGRAHGGASANLGFADFAVLYRTEAQSAALVEAFARSGIPFKKSSHEPLMRAASGPRAGGGAAVTAISRFASNSRPRQSG